MAFKSSFLCTVINAYEDLKLSRYDLKEKRKVLSEEYKPEIVNRKMLEYINNNKKAEEVYNKRVTDSYNRALEPLKKEYDKNFSGSALTDDIKLLNSGIKLSKDEVQYLVDRYKDNNLMLRALSQYVEANNIGIMVNTENRTLIKMKTLEETYNMMLGYSKDEFKMSFNAIVEDYLPKADKVLMGDF